MESGYCKCGFACMQARVKYRLKEWDMRIFIAWMVCLLCVNCAHAADRASRSRTGVRTLAREIIMPLPPFQWGDTVVAAMGKICAMQPLPTEINFGNRKFGCNGHVDLNITDDEPLHIFGPEQNVSLLNYKGIGIQVGTGHTIRYSPLLIGGVAYEATLQFNSISEGYGTYLYETEKDQLPWMSQKGGIIYLPVILTSLRLTPLNRDQARVELKNSLRGIKSRYGKAFVREVDNDMTVFHRGGTWLHVYDDGDIFYDGETYLKNRFAPYENYYLKHGGPGGR